MLATSLMTRSFLIPFLGWAETSEIKSKFGDLGFSMSDPVWGPLSCF